MSRVARRWLGRIVLLAVAFGYVSLASLSGATEVVRVASFNLQNYLVTDRMVEGVYRLGYPKPEAAKTALRGALLTARPNVLAVQEIGNASYVRELQRDLAAEGLDYPHTAWLDGPDPMRRLAVFSQIPMAEVIDHATVEFSYFGEPTLVKRGMQEIIFESPAGPWRLYNVHLKSRWTMRPDDPAATEQRVGEAQALRDRIRAQIGGEGDALAPALLLGDFNDTRSSRTLARFLSIGGRTLFQEVACVDQRGERWTHYYPKEDVYSRVDFILVSPSLAPALVEGSGHILDLPEFASASDHRLLWVDLRFVTVE